MFVARGEEGRHAQAIADQVRRLQRESQTGHDFFVLWVPRRTLLADAILEEAGVLGDVSSLALPLFFFPLEHDVLSLELNDAFRDLYRAHDPTPTFLLAKALMGVQQRHGLFPRILGKGEHAQRVAELLARFRQELLAGEAGDGINGINGIDEGGAGGGGVVEAGLAPSTTLESLILIDREADPVTPLLTQLTYEGLIDELYGIQNSQTEVDATIVGTGASGLGETTAATGSTSTTATSTSGPGSASANSAAAAARKRKIPLDSSDTLYATLRDANFAVVGARLNKAARRLQSGYDSRHATRTTAELREFVARLPGYQAEQASLKVHAGLVEAVYRHTSSDAFRRLLEVQQNLAAGADPTAQADAVEELVARGAPLRDVLRLLCLYSSVAGGVRAREHEQFRRLVLQGYGHQHLLTLQALEALRLFVPRASPLAGVMLLPGAATAAAAAAVAGSRTNYTVLRKQLRLIVDEVSEQNPDDIAYVYSGYAPLSVRLVQCILQKQYLQAFVKGGKDAAGAKATNSLNATSKTVEAPGWRGFEEAAKHVRGPTVDAVQQAEDPAARARALLAGSAGRRTVFVVFVGGITFAEIAALRFLARQEEGRRQIVICTTSLISGNAMMDAAIETGSFQRAEGATA